MDRLEAKKIMTKNHENNKAFVMLFVITISSILLAIALGVANVTFKEVKFTTSAKDTNDAFLATDTGIEFALFRDKGSSFYAPAPGTWTETLTGLGASGTNCAKVTIIKDTSSPPDVGTSITAKGYSTGDGSCNATNPVRTERELKVTYGSVIPDATNRFIAVGSGTNSIAYSPDGIVWTGVTGSTSLFSTMARGVASNGTRWVAVGEGANSIAYSNDGGTTWTGLGTSIFDTWARGVAWNGTRFVAVGGNSNTIAYSSDGITWTGLGTSIFSTSGVTVAWNGTRFVAGGEGTNTLAYSADGITWTGLGTTTFDTDVYGIAWNGTRFVAGGIGATNTLAYSADGITWTGLGTGTFSVEGTGIAWNGTRFVAMGGGGNSIAYSADGITWTGIGLSIFDVNGWGVAWNGTRFVGVGQGSVNSLGYSADGITWTGLGLTTFSGWGRGVASLPAPSLYPPIAGGSGGGGGIVTPPNVGTVVLVKNTTGGNGTFFFTTTGGSTLPANANITTSGGTATLVFNNVAAGPYSISETVPSGWNLTSSNCSSGTPASFSVTSGGTITCTFNDTATGTPGTVILVANTSGGGDGTFNFTTTGGGSMPVSPTVTTSGGTASMTFNNIGIGTYSISENSSAGWALSSSNCSSGTPASFSVTAGATVTCTFNNDPFVVKFVATGTGTNSLAYSADGITWTGLGTSIFSSSTGTSASNGTRWVSSGTGTNSLAYSADGVTWTGLGTSIFSTAGRGAVWNGTRFVAFGQGASNTLAYSADGISWTGLGTSIFSVYGRSAAWNGTRFVAGGNGATNTLAYSTDGISWTGNGKTIFDTTVRGIAWSGTRFVAVGDANPNTIAYSTDGITWTGIGKSIFSSVGYAVAWNGTRFVAAGEGTNTLAYSADGITWTGLGTSIFNTRGWGVSWNGTRFVAVGEGTTNTLAYSTDGISWTGNGKTIFSTSGNGVASNPAPSLVPGIGSSSGTVVLVKNTSLGNGTFNFTTTGGSNLSSAPSITTSGGTGSQTFNSVSTGTYSITETVPSLWSLSSSNCSTGTPASFSVTANATVTCTFNNAPTPLPSFAHHRQISINSGQVSGGPLTSFPVLVNFTDVTLKDVAHSGGVQSSTGLDIVFTSDSAGTTRIPYEQEKYDPTTGEIEYWVNIASLSNSSVFYMFYGASGSTDFSNKNAVWDTNYKMVQHFPNGTTLTVNDSTSNAHNGTNVGATATTGKIDGGGSFNGTSSRIDFTNHADYQLANVRTVSFWMKPSSLSNTLSRIIDSVQTASSTGWSIVFQGSTDSPANSIGVGINSTVVKGTPINSVNSTATWYYVVVTLATTPAVSNIYLNGTAQTLGTPTTYAPGSVAKMSIGVRTDPLRWFPGIIEEVRISNVTRSSSWITTEYNNQSAPATFYTMGAEQTP